MAADLSIAAGVINIKGIAGSGSETQVDINAGVRRVYAHAEDELVLVATTAAATAAIATSVEIPADTGLVLYDGPPTIDTMTVYLLQATAAGTTQFVVNS